MWTKRNDHAPNVNVLIVFDICLKRENLKEKRGAILTICLSSLVFHLHLPQKKSIKIYDNNISLPWALAFSYHSTSFVSPTAKPVGPCQWVM